MSLIAFVAIVGLGSALAAFEESGAQVLGSFLAFGGIVAFAAAALLAFGPDATFRSQAGRVLAILAAGLALVPLLGVLAAIGMFVRPFDSAAPALDIGLVALGLAIAAGAAGIVKLGAERQRRSAGMPQSVHVSVAEATRRRASGDGLEQIDGLEPLPRFAPDIEPERRLGGSAAFDFDDEVRVRKV